MTENKFDEMEVTPLSDEMLDEVAGGVIHHNSNGKWDVIEDGTSQVRQSFDSRGAAIAYAKKNGISTKIV